MKLIFTNTGKSVGRGERRRRALSPPHKQTEILQPQLRFQNYLTRHLENVQDGCDVTTGPLGEVRRAAGLPEG